MQVCLHFNWWAPAGKIENMHWIKGRQWNIWWVCYAKCQCNSIHFSNWFDGKYIEDNALSYCKLFISSLIWIRQGVSVAWPWCSRFYCLALAVFSARWEFLKLSASLVQTTLGYHKLANVCMPFFTWKICQSLLSSYRWTLWSSFSILNFWGCPI